ncbi:HAD family hydrolase [Yinghuangia seranimata]|uniref:HAD family hydrolase n=1 Tax=Yinghuangia seranimata TaxID=408067 RepID=UPI00248C9A20|nr:HAD family phosphatase [Yinghuangia seranimata]MDI2125294.1 HAD family phosphatase [Yinghuangia seranimata]
MTTRWLVFDYGEVICHRSTAVPAMAASVGAPVEAFDAAYWELRDAYDRGMADEEYWTRVGERAGFTVDAARSAALTAADVAGWLNTVPESLALLDDLTAAGVPLALLSNAPAAHGRAFETQPWAKYFRHLVISADHLTAKPDPEIWRVLTDRLGAAPADCAFIDDRPTNIDGARAAGLSGHVWTGPDVARGWLAAEGLLG